MFDLVIIGAGPAGLAAAIHAKRFDLNCIVLERGKVGGQARAANLITNYPGFPNGISGRELMGPFIKQAETAGVEFKRCEVSRVSLRGGCHSRESGNPVRSRDPHFRGDDVFNITTSHGRFESHFIILATGLEPVHLPLPLWERVRGEGIYYYPVPEEVPHEGKNVLIIGGGDSAFDEALSFSKKAARVTVAMRGDRPRALERLVKQANEAGIKIMVGMTDGDIAKLKADITVACCGKRLNMDILDSALLSTVHRPLSTLQLAGDIAHPKIRHIAAAVGDGVKGVEELNLHFLVTK